jgi:tRNA (Thr-GGU) A37 N-methylase
MAEREVGEIRVRPIGWVENERRDRIFAQRASARPNGLGVTRCRLLRIEGLRLTVDGLDALDGTPVLDIKPYLEEFGPRGPVHQPQWTRELMHGYFD